MTAPQFLSSLQSRGVQLVPDASAASGVRVRAPRGVVTGPVLEKIRAALPMLLPLIEDRVAPGELSEAGRESPPGEADPKAFSAYVSMLPAFSAVGSVPTFDQWKAEREPLELAMVAREIEEALAEGEEAGFAGEWAACLESLQNLPSRLLWPKSPGVEVPDVARWLQLAGERRNRLYRLHGAAWRESRQGRELTEDLAALRVWLLE